MDWVARIKAASGGKMASVLAGRRQESDRGLAPRRRDWGLFPAGMPELGRRRPDRDGNTGQWAPIFIFFISRACCGQAICRRGPTFRPRTAANPNIQTSRPRIPNFRLARQDCLRSRSTALEKTPQKSLNRSCENTETLANSVEQPPRARGGREGRASLQEARGGREGRAGLEEGRGSMGLSERRRCAPSARRPR